MMWIAFQKTGPKTRASLVDRAPHARSALFGVGAGGEPPAEHVEPFQEHFFLCFPQPFFFLNAEKNCANGTHPASPAPLGPAQPQSDTELHAFLHFLPGQAKSPHWARAPPRAAASSAARKAAPAAR